MRNSENTFLLNLRNISIIVTLISFSYSGYVLYNKYNFLKHEIKSKLGEQIYDEIFCCDFSFEEEERKNQEIEEKYKNVIIDPITVNNWIKIKLSKMGSMESQLYNYYFKTWDRKSVSNEIIAYKIKCEQNIAQEKFKNQRDSFNYVRGLQYERVLIQKVNEVDIIGFFPFAYLIGAFLGTIALPLLFWLTWYYFKFIKK